MPPPDVIGVEVGRSVVRGVRVDADHNVIVAVGELPLPRPGVDRDGVIEPGVVGEALDALVVGLGVTDRSQVRVGMTIGPRNAGVGSGPAMVQWLKAQATRLSQPFVCAGGLGVAFVPIRSIDQAVKTAFDIGLDLQRVDLAPVATARAIGDQVDDLVCVGSGRGWQARMRDFEVLEAMENQQVAPEDPVHLVGPSGTYTIARYGWIDLSADLQASREVDIARMATAVGAAVGVLYESPANLLDGKVIAGRRAAAQADARPEPPAERTVRTERTLQLSTVQAVDGGRSAGTVEAEPYVEPDAGRTTRRLAAAAGREREPTVERLAVRTPVPASTWDDNRLVADDPINLFSPDTDEANMLSRSLWSSGFVVLVVVLAIVAAGLGAVYLLG